MTEGSALSTFADRPPQPLQAYDRKRVASVALKAFFRLAEEWGLNTKEQLILLGEPSNRTYYRWKSGQVAELPKDTLERISVLLGIYKALHILLPVPERANAWIGKPNEAYGGRSALEVMLTGQVDSLYRVRRHLDAWRG